MTVLMLRFENDQYLKGKAMLKDTRTMVVMKMNKSNTGDLTTTLDWFLDMIAKIKENREDNYFEQIAMEGI